MGQQVKEIDGSAHQPHQVQDKMKDLMPLCPEGPPGWVDRMRRKIPMEIIAADGREEDKPHQSSGRGSAQQQMTGLPDHQYSTQGNVKAAENKKVE